MLLQSDYFSFDVVDFYNQHQLAIVGEELSGAPAVGFFEAMACGCVTLGQRGAYYDGLGLEPGVHYLRHDGTIESLKKTIEEAIADPEHTSRISKAGLAYIASHCTRGRVWEKLKGDMGQAKHSYWTRFVSILTQERHPIRFLLSRILMKSRWSRLLAIPREGYVLRFFSDIAVRRDVGGSEFSCRGRAVSSRGITARRDRDRCRRKYWQHGSCLCCCRWVRVDAWSP